jgi:hypothetical protein
MEKYLQSAVVDSSQIIRASHPLAAMNHRHWIRWEDLVLREPETLVPANLRALYLKIQSVEFSLLLRAQAEDAINAVRCAVGDFAFEPDVNVVQERKLEQLRGWIDYAVSRPGDEHTRWLLQCRIPFLELSRDAQMSDYIEAEKDFRVVASAGGLVLPDKPLLFKPQTDRQLRRLRMRHSVGAHGWYKCSEQPYKMICAACHAEWSVW